MDAASQNVVRFLQTIGDIHAAFEFLQAQLQRHPYVADSKVWYFKPKLLEIQNVCNADFGLAIELKDTTFVDWWLDLTWGQDWRLEHNVHLRKPKEEGSHIAIAFPEIRCAALDEMTAHLTTATQDLLDTVSVNPPFITEA